jgi:excisionase family DNA binding protein
MQGMKIDLETDSLLSAKQAIEELGISKPTLYRWIEAGKRHVIKVGGHTLFAREEIASLKRRGGGSGRETTLAAQASADDGEEKTGCV